MLGRRTRVLLLTAALPLTLVTGAGAITATTAVPAYASSKGNCKGYVSTSPGGRDMWKIAYAGSSSGWSPPGKLSMSLTLTVDGRQLGSANSSKSDATYITYMPDAIQWGGASAPSVSLKVRVSGPAGTVTCTA
jgi:hypothetical protein